MKRTTDLLDGRVYDVHQYNQELAGTPVLIYLGLGTTALNSTGKAYLAEYAGVINRPLINLHLRTDHHTSFEARAQSDAEMIVRLGVDTLDVVGASSGGLHAAYLASQVGEKAQNLVTVSAVGTKKGYLDYARSLPSQFLDGVVEFLRVRQQKESGLVIDSYASDMLNLPKYWETLKTARLAGLTSLQPAIDGLDQTTKWHDIIGTRDHMTDYRDHLALIRNRNQRVLGSSSLYLLCGGSHMWASKRALLAEMVADAIA